MGRVDGKIALVTGGAGGMGRAIVRALEQEGATVVAADIPPAWGSDDGVSVGDRGLLCVDLDVTRPKDWERVTAMVRREHGRLDVLVNAAGVLGNGERLSNTTLEEYDRVVSVNQTGVFLGLRAAARLMEEDGGSVVNVSSVSGLVGYPRAIAYVASKFAVRGMTKSAAVELGRFGIRVNSVHPGRIDTPMLDIGGYGDRLRDPDNLGDLPLGRVGQPEEVAALVLFLASNESGYCTGAEFVVDGGRTAGP